MTFLSYKRVFVAIALVLSGFVAFGSTGVQGQGLNIGDGLDATIGGATESICSLSTKLSDTEAKSILGRDVASADVAKLTSGANRDQFKTGDAYTISPAEWSGLCGYSLAKVIINWVSIIVGIVALLFILFAAFLYIQGRDSGATNTKARNTLIAAIVGSVVAILAQVILRVIRGFF